MATIKTKNEVMTHFYTVTSPYGNSTTQAYQLKANTGGALANSDSTTAPKAGDVIDLGELLEGWCLTDAQVFITKGLSATITGSLGFVYEDGVDDIDVPQDAEYFIKAGADLATAGRLRADGSDLVVLPKSARLILTLAGATNAKEADIKVTVTGELTGYR